MLGNTLEPYKYLIMVLLGVLLLFMLTRFPHCKPQTVQRQAAPGMAETLRYLAGNRRFRRGVLAQFLYVGLQVAVWSFTIRLALTLGANNERHASNFMPATADVIQRYLELFILNLSRMTAVGTCGLIVTALLLIYSVDTVLNSIAKRLNFDYITYMSYSIYFRRKVISTREEEGLSIRETENQFRIGFASVSRWINQIEPKASTTRQRKSINPS